MESKTFKIVTPIDNSIYYEGALQTENEIAGIFRKAEKASLLWAKVSLPEKKAIVKRFIEIFVAKKRQIADIITWQIGRPIRFSGDEVIGTEERTLYALDSVEEALRNLEYTEQQGIKRYIQRVPYGIALIIAPWNYPFLTSINSIVPGLLSGNVIVLKHAKQTHLCSVLLDECFKEAGLPDGVFQYFQAEHSLVEKIIESNLAKFIAFTGSVDAGKIIERKAAGNFQTVNLELGGKDAAYVLEDADIEKTVSNLAEGTYYNSGQCCCGIERIYVQEKLYKDFVEAFVEETKKWQLGRPDESETFLGPVVNTKAAHNIRLQIDKAIQSGAKALIDKKYFPFDKLHSPYLAPQVLVEVDHTMGFMREETFGPTVGIMSVNNDHEAVKLINDSDYGLTSSIWTKDMERAKDIGEKIEAGIIFMNRCDYLDPALCWTGRKNTGRGCSLSVLGFQTLTYPKSFHLRHVF